jgi:hypothetical protein
LCVQQCDAGDRAAAVGLLCDIADGVPKDVIQPQPLFDSLRTSFQLLPFRTEFLRPLAVYASIGGKIPLFLAQSRLSVEALFSLLAVAEAAVLGILRSLAESDDIVSGIGRELNDRVLASFGITALNSVAQPYSLDVARLLLAIGRAVTADDATVVQFKTLLIGASLAAAQGGQTELAALAIETINTLVH